MAIRHALPVLLFLSVALPAAAQEPEVAPGATPEADSATTQLDDVVVTAERRVATVQDTPISIEAFNNEKLALRGIEGVADLSANVPGMVIEPFPTHNATLRVSIRGVGVNDAQVTQDPAVGIYLDGVYLARAVGLAVDVADLERIEVLRGPQGTLYGRNTTGGAVNLVSRRPSFDVFSMTHRATFGDRNLALAKSSFNIPLLDNLAMKLSLLGATRDGFVENTGPGGDFGDRQEWAARFDLRWMPADWLIADYSYDRTDLEYYNYLFQSQIPSFTNHGQAELFKPFAQANTVYATERLDALATGMPLEASASRVRGHTVTLTSSILEGIELKYIGAFRELVDDQYVDLGGGAGSLDFRLDTHVWDGPSANQVYGGPTPLVIPQVFQEQWSHELQASGSLFGGQVEWIAGAYHFEEEGGEHGAPVHHIGNVVLDPEQLGDTLDLIPGLEEALTGLVLPRLVIYWDYEYQIRNEATALFGQLGWTPDWFDRRLHLTAGLRKSWDERGAVKDYVALTYVEGRLGNLDLVAIPLPAALQEGNDTFVDVQAYKEYDDLSGSMSLQFDVTPQATAYLSWASAYKSGGFNLRDPQVSGASGPASDGTTYGFGFVDGFKPERVRSLEAGLKSEWWGRRLRFNASVYESDYRDMQTNFLIPGTISDTKSRNAGRARMRGVEIDTAVVPVEDLVLGLTYAYLDADVEEVIDFSGNNVAHLYPFIAAPPHSWVVSADWTFLRGAWGDLRAYVNAQHVGDKEGLVIVEERRGATAADAYTLYNARLIAGGIRLGGQGWLDVSLWGKNLADEEYPATLIDNLPQADRAIMWGEPRMIGVDLVYRWF